MTDNLMAQLYYSNEQHRRREAEQAREAKAMAVAMPDVFELIATIKDMHPVRDGVCTECRVPGPCRTAAYVDGLLSSRFEG